MSLPSESSTSSVILLDTVSLAREFELVFNHLTISHVINNNN